MHLRIARASGNAVLGPIAAWCAGVAIVQTFAVIPLPWWAWLAVASAVFVAHRRMNRASAEWRRAAPILVAVGSLVGGIAYGVLRAEVRLADALPHDWEGEDIVVTGVVGDLPRTMPRGVRLVLDVERVLTAGAVVPRRVSLAWVVGFPDAERGIVVPPVRAGERWQLTVRLQRPRGLSNPGAFDLEAWLLERNLRATGYVRNDAGNVRLGDFAGRLSDRIQRMREAIRDRVAAELPDARYAAVLVALAIGEQSGLDDALWSVFNRTGTGHLVSVSGLHVTVFALLAGGAAFAVLRRWTSLSTRVPARKVAVLVGLAASAAYVLLAGAEVPARRTLFMLAVGAAGLWMSRPGSGVAIWLAALAVVLALDPWAVLGAGCWLSFFAVGVLIYAGSGRLEGHAVAPDGRARIARWLANAARAQAAITLGLVPLSLLLFGQVSLVGPFANAIAIPAVTFVIVPLALTAALCPVVPLWPLAHEALALLMQVLDPLAALPDAAWVQHRPPPVAVPFALVGVAVALAPCGVPGRALGLIALLPMLLLVPPRPPPGAFRMMVLDVGQGTAVVVETHAHALLYDTGPRWNDAADAGGRVVAPVLRTIGVRRLDTLVVSHRDLDHAGGAMTLLQQVPVGLLMSSLEEGNPIIATHGARGPHLRCVHGQSWQWDGVRFDVLFPDARHYDDPQRKPNDLSCVLRIVGAHGSVLLAGDIEAVSEQALLLDRREFLAVDVLLAPHHGSRTSSTAAFVAAVAARDVVFTVGHRNRFGHPRADVIARYADRGATLHRTDRSGALTFVFDAQQRAPPQAERDRGRRYWHDRPP